MVGGGGGFYVRWRLGVGRWKYSLKRKDMKCSIQMFVFERVSQVVICCTEIKIRQKPEFTLILCCHTDPFHVDLLAWLFQRASLSLSLPPSPPHLVCVLW